MTCSYNVWEKETVQCNRQLSNATDISTLAVDVYVETRSLATVYAVAQFMNSLSVKNRTDPFLHAQQTT